MLNKKTINIQMHIYVAAPILELMCTRRGKGWK